MSPAAEPPITPSPADHFWKVSLLLLTFLLGCFDLSNGDIWWHLRTGQLIWERGEVPQTDWFTFTNPSAPWTDLHWGFQLAAVALWGVGGSAALILAKSFLGSATFAFCLSLRSKALPSWLLVGLWVPSLLIFAGRYYVRPEVVSLLLLAATLWIFSRAEEKPRYLWFLPLLQLIWVNVQGLFVLQFVVMACFGIDFFATARQAERATAYIPTKTLIASYVTTLMASLANPYGVQGTLLPYTLFQRVSGPHRAFYRRYSAEFRGTGEFISEFGLGAFQDLTILLLACLFTACCGTFAWLFLRRALRLYRLLLFMAFTYLTWQMSRNSVLFAIVAGAILTANISDITALVQTNSRESNRSNLPQILRWFVAALLAGFMISLPTGIYHQTRRAAIRRHFGFGEAAWFGHDAAKFLSQAGMPKHIYATHEGQAAVCLYHLGPEKRIFVDARLETHTRETLQRYLQIRNQIATFDPAVIDNLTREITPDATGKREIPAIVVDNNTLLLFSARQPGFLTNLTQGLWRCVYSDTHGPVDRQMFWHIRNGTSVFLTREKTAELDLPTADLSAITSLLSPR